MILVADSGSTKTDWRIIDSNDQISQARTKGINPYYQRFEEIRDEISVSLLDQLEQPEAIKRIFFYGAGCSSPSNKNLVSQALNFSFPESDIEVNHDLLAAARALCGSEAGIACILGTGSNSCVYDGEQITENIPSLGWALADEGSGVYFGKRLIGDFLRKGMPDEIHERFTKRFELNKNTILDRVYNQEMPSRFIAGFTKFIFDNISEPYLYSMVYDGFEKFFKINVMKYDGYETYKVSFTGSIAFYFNNILRQVAVDNGITIGHIAENPIAGLALYHLNALSN